MLAKLGDKIFKSFEDNNYKTVINIAYWTYMIIGLSYIYMYLFETEMFKLLDTVKLLILCVGFNLIIIFILLISIYRYLEIKNNSTNENLDDYLFEESIIRLKSLILLITIGMFLFKIYMIIKS